MGVAPPPRRGGSHSFRQRTRAPDNSFALIISLGSYLRGPGVPPRRFSFLKSAPLGARVPARSRAVAGPRCSSNGTRLLLRPLIVILRGMPANRPRRARSEGGAMTSEPLLQETTFGFQMLRALSRLSSAPY